MTMLVLWLIGFLTILAIRTALLFRPRRRSGGLAAEIIAIPDVEIEEPPLGRRHRECAIDRGRDVEIAIAGTRLAEPDAERATPRLVSHAADRGRIDFGDDRISLHADENRNGPA